MAVDQGPHDSGDWRVVFSEGSRAEQGCRVVVLEKDFDGGNEKSRPGGACGRVERQGTRVLRQLRFFYADTDECDSDSSGCRCRMGGGSTSGRRRRGDDDPQQEVSSDAVQSEVVVWAGHPSGGVKFVRSDSLRECCSMLRLTYHRIMACAALGYARRM